MSLFQFGFSRRSGHVGEKKLKKKKTNGAKALQTLQSLKRGRRKKEKCLAVDFVKSGRKNIHG